jgi:hypothetical protein
MIARNSQPEYLTPHEVASILRVGYEKVLYWITHGTLQASDCSSNPGRGKARYRIAADDFEKLKQQLVVKVPEITRREKPPTPAETIEWF